ncbi:hypothetical protein CH365_19455 [Leptospira neocaledonica]|uniref:Uncharacterized protein n=1 Tax=Leptospira neocaledonica TaxID=2023192 RepID=A0A2M9ZT69_9LEPT|nr:hypothetical protein CH365_19455 [Leptospira neocaledonica]
MAFIVPWLFLKNDFDIIIPLDKYNSLSEAGKKIVDSKLSLISYIYIWMPYYFFASSFFGLVSLTYGLLNWKKGQKVIDLEIAEKLRTFQENTTLVKESERKDIVKSIIASEYNIKNKESLNVKIQKYVDVERQIIKILLEFNSFNYSILTERKVGEHYFDAILIPTNKLQYECIVSVKYLTKKLDTNKLQEIITNNLALKSAYSSVMNSLPLLLNIIVVPTKTSDDTKVVDKFEKDEKLKRVKTVLIAESEINDLSDLGHLADRLKL